MEGAEKKLTPMAFRPEKVELPWGTIDYCLADLGYVDSTASSGWLSGSTISDIMQTYLERVVGETSFEYYGTQFPVMVKCLDVKGRSSLHVNPDDETAAQRYDAFGKTALWYVADAGPEACLWLGFRRDVTAEEFYRSCQDNTVEKLLNPVKPRKGEHFLIMPGQVHAAKDVKLIEIAESSELWFRLHDWGQTERELHLEEAFDLIDFRASRVPRAGKAAKEAGPAEKIAVTPQFTVSEIRLRDPLQITAGPADSFQLYTCVNGAAAVRLEKGPDAARYPVRPGQALLVPAEVESFFLVPEAPDTLLLETMLDPRPEEDNV